LRTVDKLTHNWAWPASCDRSSAGVWS